MLNNVTFVRNFEENYAWYRWHPSILKHIVVSQGERPADTIIYKIITLYAALVEKIVKLKRAVAGREILREPL